MYRILHMRPFEPHFKGHYLVQNAPIREMDPSHTDDEKQENRTFLRERFLRLMASLNGQESEIAMFEKTKVTATLRAMDVNVQTVQVSNLQTPIGMIPDATLRLSDILSISMPDFKTS